MPTNEKTFSQCIINSYDDTLKLLKVQDDALIAALESFHLGVDELLDSIHTALVALNADLNSFASQNHTDLLAVQGSLSSIDSKVATSAKQDTGNTSLASIDTKVSTAAKQDTGNNSLSSIDTKLTSTNSSLSSIDTKVATAANQATSNASLSSIDGKLTTSNTNTGNTATSAASIDTKLSTTNTNTGNTATSTSSIDSKLTTTNSSLSTIATNTGTTATNSGTTATNTGTIATNSGTTNTRIGDLTEAAPASDTASSGLNGRLQRVAQRLTSLISTVSTETTLAALSAKFNSLGQKTMANSAPVVIASDQSNLPANVTQFGGTNVATGTGNSGSGIPRVTVSNDSSITNITGTVSLPTGAATAANQTNGNQKVQITDVGGSLFQITRIDTGNSTSGPLGSNAAVTGSWTDVSNFSTLSVVVFTDQASATNGLTIQYSTDGTNVDDNDQYTIPASNGQQLSFPLAARYYRIVYTNGGVAQTVFRLQAKLHSAYIKPSSYRISAGIVNGEQDLEAVMNINGRLPLTASTPTTVSAGVASGTLIAANASRKGLIVTNTSSLGTISLHLAGGTAVLNSGITLYPRDVFYMDEWTFTTSQINVIASAAATGVAIQEFVL